MKLPQSWTTVTPLSKLIALILFVSLPFAGFLVGVKYQQTVTIPEIKIVKNTIPASPTSINVPNIDTNVTDHSFTVSDFKVKIPSLWKTTQTGQKNSISIITATTPYSITLTLDIIKTTEKTKGNNVLGKTMDGGLIYEEVGIGGAALTPYLVIYPNAITYNFQWNYDSTQPEPSPLDEIWFPDKNFKDSDLLEIVKSSQRINSSSEKLLVGKALVDYLDAIINDNREIALSYLTAGVKKDVSVSWPSDMYSSYNRYEILNEFHSQKEEDLFYSKDRLIFPVKLYRNNNVEGSQTDLMFVKENGVWKTLSWYLFQ